MPTPTIPAGNLFMNATTYTGTGAALTVTNGAAGASFQPDLVWIKSRNNVTNNNLTDSVRGVTKLLFSNSTAAEATFSGGVSSFNSNGFSLASGGDTGFSASGYTYVGWNWKAGGTAVSNTAGTITSQVSANTTSGFSVVTWVHSSTTSTIGHGLGVAPQFLIVKSRTTAYNWDVGCTSIGWGNRLNLNTTDAAYSPAFWNSTAPTSTVFTYAGSGASNGDNMVAYCFTPIAGYSAFSSYTGNGSSDGPFIYTGFRPRFVMIKRSTGADEWIMIDSSRDTYNLATKTLYANQSNAEENLYNHADLLSNGFKLRTTNSGTNQGSNTYIYMAFAENPFKYANARQETQCHILQKLKTES